MSASVLLQREANGVRAWDSSIPGSGGGGGSYTAGDGITIDSSVISANLTAGSGVTITPNAGALEIASASGSAPQVVFSQPGNTLEQFFTTGSPPGGVSWQWGQPSTVVTALAPPTGDANWTSGKTWRVTVNGFFVPDSRVAFRCGANAFANIRLAENGNTTGHPVLAEVQIPNDRNDVANYQPLKGEPDLAQSAGLWPCASQQVSATVDFTIGASVPNEVILTGYNNYASPVLYPFNLTGATSNIFFTPVSCSYQWLS